MAHARKLIRQAVVAQLIAAGTAAGSRVEATRMIPQRRATEAAIGVYTPAEESEQDARTAPRELKRDLQLIIEGIVVGTSGVDDALDDLAEQVEAALDADDTLGGTAAESQLLSTDLETIEDGAKTVGLVRLTYRATYYAFAPVVVSAPDAFLVADVKHNPGGGVHPLNQAEDIVEPEQ